MAIITRTGIRTYHCIDGVICDDVIDAIFMNKLTSSMKALADTGVLAANFSNGMTHGRTRPYNGWAPGSNYLTQHYWTQHMVELAPMFDRYVLQFTAKLGARAGGRNMQWVNFWLQDESGAPITKLGELKLNSYVINSPVEFLAPAEQETRVRIDLPLATYMLAPAGSVISLDVRSHTEQYGATGDFTINDNNYWAGILNMTLHFYKSCP